MYLFIWEKHHQLLRIAGAHDHLEEATKWKPVNCTNNRI